MKDQLTRRKRAYTVKNEILLNVEELDQRIGPGVLGGGNSAQTAHPENTANPEGSAVPEGGHHDP